MDSPLTMEIRKIPLDKKSKLIVLLEAQDSWRKVVAAIPSFLDPDDYQTEITPKNPAKYTSEDVRIIEEAAFKERKYPSEIFLREWGTSGRNIRPTVQHLLYFLVKQQLLAAADYVAVDILGREPPERPQTGPGAPVDFNNDELAENVTEQVVGMNVPYTVLFK